MSKSDAQYIIRIERDIININSSLWNACAHPQNSIYNPFTSYEFLSALEKSASVCAEEGWLPHHLILCPEGQDNDILGVMPCYIKSHSYGEYVFDHAWADAYMRYGMKYYPKLQCSIPFTPATGPRFLIHENAEQDKCRKLFASGAVQLVEKLGLSSFHCTFLSEDECSAMGDMGFLVRQGQQFHWQNQGYHSFDDFLDSLSSRKRKAIRKERREALSQNIEIEWVTGKDLQDMHWDHFYDFYLDTSMRKWGQAYLKREFFSLINETMKEHILLILCRRDGKIIAGALNFIGGDTLYGRNWGAIEDHKFLHFEACYYQAIDFAITHGLSRVEAGAQGAHKLARGYLPTTTYSTHYISDPELRRAIAHYLDGEQDYIELEKQSLCAHSPYANRGSDAKRASYAKGAVHTQKEPDTTRVLDGNDSEGY